MSDRTDRRALCDELLAAGASQSHLYRAPGRVNIVGEHTDYNEGLVLPTTTAVYTWFAVAARSDGVFNVQSLNLNESASFRLTDEKTNGDGSWISYLFGVATLLKAAGIESDGADVIIDSDIPIGGGLSSSAALEVGFATALVDLAGAQLTPSELALICQQAEIKYAGVNCGVMDQLAVACCERDHAMMLDCRDLTFEPVALTGDFNLLLTDSGVKHSLSDSDYNRRAEECTLASAIIGDKEPGVVTLRDVTSNMLEEHKHLLSDTLYRRSRHVVNENQRVRDAFLALQSSDAESLGNIVTQSHLSLRDDFDVSCNEIDTLFEIANSTKGVLGSRMVGAGFGGCVLSVVLTANREHVEQQIKDGYQAKIGKQPWTHWVEPAGSAQKVEL